MSTLIPFPVALPFSSVTLSPALFLSPTFSMSYVVASKVKELLKGMNMMTAGDFADALSKEVESMVKRAGKRAEANGRKTVQDRDL